MNKMKHFVTECHWCKKGMSQRCDTYKRQITKYGHSCCKYCFGNEQTFKDNRSRAMIENNPFKGKTHSEKTKAILALKATGRPAWNKGKGKGKKKVIIPGSINKWMNFKNQFLKDFGDCCLKCGTKNRLEVHHIASKKRYIQGHYEERNCIALCYWCHKEFHNKYSRRYFRPEDTFTWLNEGRNPENYVTLC